MITAKRSLALAATRASLACTRLFLAMHNRRGCADCGYGHRSCTRARFAKVDAECLISRVSELERGDRA